MFGNVVNKARLKDLMEKRAITITGFVNSKMRTIHYPLRPIRVYERGNQDSDGLVDRRLKHDFSKSTRECSLSPNEYVIVEAYEQIAMMQDGLVGHFVLPSHFIERGLALMAGRIESPYGQGGEAVRFGLKNMLNKDTSLLASDTLAYVYFVDLLSLRNEDPYQPSEQERKLSNTWRRDRLGDSGVPSDRMDED